MGLEEAAPTESFPEYAAYAARTSRLLPIPSALLRRQPSPRLQQTRTTA
jgi:hypothetical protein